MKNFNFDLTKARELQVKGKFEEAVETYHHIINTNPNFSWYYYNLAECLVELERLDEANIAYHQALELNPNCAWFYYGLAEVLVKQGKLTEAVQVYSQAIEILPDFYLFHNNLGQVLAQQGKVDDAIFRYRQAIKIRPNSAVAYYNLGQILKQQRKFGEAIVEYRKAVALNPNFQYYHDLGLVLLIKGKLDEAVFFLQNCININPNFFWGYHHFGNALRDQNKLDLAVIAYRQAIEINPNFFKSHINIADVLVKQNQLEEAIVAYRQALEIKPNDSATSEKLMQIEVVIKILKETNGKLEDIITSDGQIVEGKSWSDQLYLSLGNFLEKQGKLDEAINIYHQAIKVAPKSYNAYVNLGLALEKSGRFDEAIAQYQKSFQVQPSTIDNYIHNHKLTVKFDPDKAANQTNSKVKRIVAVSKPNMLINALAVLKFQQENGEYQECDDFLVILAEFNSKNHADITLQIAKTWQFKGIFSIQRVAEIVKKNNVSFATAGELIRKELNLDIDILYTVSNWTITDKLILEAYPNVRKIAFGDSLGQLTINDKNIQLNDAYLTAPLEMHGDAFAKSKLTLVPPKFFKSAVEESAKNIEGLAEYCQKIEAQLGNSITIYLTKYYSQLGWISLTNEVQMYVDLILSYTEPGEGILVKGHPTQGKEQSKLVAEKLNEHDRKALDMNDDFFNKIPVELLGVFLKINKAMGLSTSCISLASLYKSDIVLGWGDKIKQYFQPGAQHRNLVLERCYYLQIQQAYQEKFEPLRFTDVDRNFDKFPNFPVLLRYKDAINSSEKIELV